jgi:signal transduction histidine kinase
MLVLVVTVTASFIAERHQASLRQRTLAINSIATQSAQVLTLLLNAESAVRGFAVSRDPSFLAPYLQAVAQAPGQVGLWSSIAPGVIGREDSDAVARLAKQQLAGLAAIRSGVASGGLSGPALEQALRQNEQVMDQLRARVTAIQSREETTLSDQSDNVDHLQRLVETIEVAGLGVGIIGGLTAMVLFVRAIVRRVGAAKANAHRLGVSEPPVPVPAAADEIGQLEQELQGANALLTQRSTDLVRYHGAAVDAAQAADELLAQVSHELRTPLTAVMGFGRLMEMSDLDEQDTESVAQILSAGEHMLRIIEKARTPSHAPQAIDVDIQPVEVGPLVDEVIGLLTPLSDARDITMTGCQENSLRVMADYQRFKQVLINLGSNAVKFNREGGRVMVSCEPAEALQVRVAVTDTGEGIPLDMLDRVFVPFDRLDADERGVEGTGIGLTLSKTFVEAMDGTIGVESTVGRGSTFWVTLPAAPDQQHPARDTAS